MDKPLTKDEQIDIWEEAEEILSLPFDFRLYEDDHKQWYLVLKPPTQKVQVH